MTDEMLKQRVQEECRGETRRVSCCRPLTVIHRHKKGEESRGKYIYALTKGIIGDKSKTRIQMRLQGRKQRKGMAGTRWNMALLHIRTLKVVRKSLQQELKPYSILYNGT